jgi:formamidopyrimidine-DNA glycosylase
VPELPEVEVVRRGLEPFSSGWQVARVEVREPRSVARHPGPVEDFIERLEGSTLKHIVRRGKFLWWITDDPDWALVAHLGMSGQILIGESTDDFGSLCRVTLDVVKSGSKPVILGFVDQRIFGYLALDRLVPTDDGLPAGLGSTMDLIPSRAHHISRDPLDVHFDEEAFVGRLRRKHTGIKRALLDQGLISGVGNIYADEALWRVGLHGDRDCQTLSAKKCLELLASVRDVFTEALDHGGTSFDWQYVTVNGQSGYFSQSLNAYGQQGKPCGRCGTAIVRERFQNRSSHRCPRCQRLPRNRIG